MNFTLRQIEVFAAVARLGSFSQAAQELFLSQPAVSMQVKSLERAIGLRLFVHAGKHIQLTDAGSELNVRATRILRMSAEASTAMADLREVRDGRLRVVATTTVGIYLVPALLGAYHQRHPEVAVSLEVANWERTSERLFSGEADVAVAGTHLQEGLKMEPFMDDELVVIAAPDHGFAGRSHVAVEDLEKEHILVRETGSGTRAALEHLFRERGLELRPAMDLSRNGAIKQVVKAGLGIAVISRGAISLELSVGELIVLDVAGFPIVRAWNIITRDNHTPPPAVEAFCREVREGKAS
ncbi:MAG: LysR family transcriptional regulator [Chloroflexota bacterium]|nr:MAG: LysR family transcriptional regulator [Chloroflexota bacterium]